MFFFATILKKSTHRPVLPYEMRNSVEHASEPIIRAALLDPTKSRNYVRNTLFPCPRDCILLEP